MNATKATAADGKTEIFNIPGHPLMVRAVDFNTALAAQTQSEQRIIAAFLERTGQYVTNDASREAAEAEAAKRERAACLAALDDVEEPAWHGYECPNTFQDGVLAAKEAIRKLAAPKGDSNG